MAIQTQPGFIPAPFANSGTKNVIPETMPTPSASAAASWTDGFPTVCSLPLASGGIPPARADFNGLLNIITQAQAFYQSGGIYGWDATIDYGPNRLVLGSDGLLYWSMAQSGPNTGAGAVNPTTDDGTYWMAPPVKTMNVDDSSNASASTAWVNSWYSGIVLPTDVYVDGTNGDDSNSGFSASDAKQTIRAAEQIFTDLTKLKPLQATIHIAPDTYNEDLRGVANVALTYLCDYVVTFHGAKVSDTNHIIYIAGTATTTDRLLAYNGGTIFLGGSTGLTLNFDGVVSTSMLTASSRGAIRGNGNGPVTVNFINGCTASLATVQGDLFGLASFNIDGGKVTFSGAVSGARYRIEHLSAIFGTGSTTYIPGTSNGISDSTSSYS